MNSWLIQHLPKSDLNQRQKLLFWSNIPFAIASLLYLNFNTSLLDHQLYLVLATAIIYLGFNLFNALQIQSKPISTARIYTSLGANIAIVFTFMVYSPEFSNTIFLFFFAIIFLAAYAFGKAALILSTLTILTLSFIYAVVIGTTDITSFTIHIIELCIGTAIGVFSYQARETNSNSTTSADFLENSPVPAFTFSIKENLPFITSTNKLATQTFPESKSSVKGSLNRIVIDADTDEISAFCHTVLSEGKTDKTSYTFIRGKGRNHEVRRLLCVASSLSGQEKITGICLLFDISQSETQRLQMAKNMQDSRISTLVAAIVHDFRNILTTIIGTAEVLEFTLTDKDSLEQVERIIASGDRGSDKITSLLELDPKTKQGDELEHINIEEAVKKSLALIRLQLPQGITLEYKVNNQLPQLQLDITQLDLILTNLINNAAQSIDKKGKVSVTISSDQDYSDTSSITLSVTDNGCGIKESDIPLVTQSFWGTRKDKGGAGLGLAVVKRAVNRLGGNLEISSSEQVGTQVNVTLPEKKQPGAKVTPSQENLPHQTPAAQKKTAKKEYGTKSCTILLVDDNTDVLASQRLLVEAMGHTALVATSGDEGLNTYKNNKEQIQMVITDFKMPVMDGIELALLLRDETPNLPIIMLTGYGESSKLSQCKELDISLILKPCGFQKLSQTIQDIQKKNPETFS